MPTVSPRSWPAPVSVRARSIHVSSLHRASGARFSLTECLAKLANRQWPDSTEFDLLMNLYESMGIAEDCHPGIVYLSWLNGMELRLRYGIAYNPAAIEMYIHNVVRDIKLS